MTSCSCADPAICRQSENVSSGSDVLTNVARLLEACSLNGKLLWQEKACQVHADKISDKKVLQETLILLSPRLKLFKNFVLILFGHSSKSSHHLAKYSFVFDSNRSQYDVEVYYCLLRQNSCDTFSVGVVLIIES